ncbi:MAG TPA: hypothetical protein ENN85_05690 [Methanoculleus sp.]|nr:hypothetical protein [Methanoculleus sp.]
MNLPACGIVILCTLLLAAPALAGEAPVTRTIADIDGDGESLLMVVLSIDGMEIGGIIETLPGGSTFEGTDHPPAQVAVSDGRAMFSVIGEGEIRYTITMPSAAGTGISGTWEDFLNETNGMVTGDGATAAEEQASPAPPPASSAPGALVAVAVVGLLLLCLHAGGGRR